MVKGVGIEVYFEGSGIGYGEGRSGGYGDIFWGSFEGSDSTVLGYYPIAGLGNGTGGYFYWGVFCFEGCEFKVTGIEKEFFWLSSISKKSLMYVVIFPVVSLVF